MLFVVIMGTLWSVIIATENGVRNVPPIFARAARTMGSKGLDTWSRIKASPCNSNFYGTFTGHQQRHGRQVKKTWGRQFELPSMRQDFDFQIDEVVNQVHTNSMKKTRRSIENIPASTIKR
jgi:hypothetical protein